MKWLKLVTIILLVLIVISIAITVILTQIYSSNKGSIEGTGFVIKESDGAGAITFDVDDYGNLYFAVMYAGIVIYDNDGEYKYTLPIQTIGGIGVIIDDGNNILVCNIRDKSITSYNSMGIYVSKEVGIDYEQQSKFFYTVDQNIRERNGIRYINVDGTVIKEKDGVKTVVFTIPTWQKWYRAFKLVLILSIVALFLRIAIPLWVKAFKRHAK